ncbi:probable carboxylesterase 6 [Rhodamnia argentea]|uniref:Probable carboxylesterase 6 n=1 Tax=Rhodamnia argentea TaxID=178133 RepID=A0A8B8QY64_9MYRT|nr:probable carboxylesterase 6 [Rhodamnia argentea]
MAAITFGPTLTLKAVGDDVPQKWHGAVTDEIGGLIRVYKDGHVERPNIVPLVSTALPPELGVASADAVVDKFTNVWARFYVPNHGVQNQLLPLIVYFHGGGFCIGSAAWSCYHEFLAKLALKVNCVIMSVNYRLAPENPLPAAYEDGFKALMWLGRQLLEASSEWWTRRCNFSRVFLAGDSAGANIAHHLAARLASDDGTELKAANSLCFEGAILIQPFFGGEARTESEKHAARQPPSSALTVAASDTYWRLALPRGSNRDHPWCNPLKQDERRGCNSGKTRVLPRTLVCVSERDILRDRNVEYCGALAEAGNVVECVMHAGVGHAFQVLSKSQMAQARALEMMSHVGAFVHR